MKIILLKDTKKLGQKNSIVSVADGYGTFLINSGSAELATDAKISAIKSKQAQTKQKRDTKNAEIEAAIEKLGKEPLKITAKANEKGHLFESITASKIVSAFKEKTGITIPDTLLELEAPIKELGNHSVGISTDKWEGTLALTIVSE